MSLVYVPDVGDRRTWEYLVRFVRANDGDGGVCEDRVFNLKSIVDAYLKRPDAVEAVEYDAASDANRVTVRLAPGVSNNAERIELFSNARESETRASDGTFFRRRGAAAGDVGILQGLQQGQGREHGLSARVELHADVRERRIDTTREVRAVHRGVYPTFGRDATHGDAKPRRRRSGAVDGEHGKRVVRARGSVQSHDRHGARVREDACVIYPTPPRV